MKDNDYEIDEKTFEKIYYKYVKHLYNFVFKKINNQGEAEEIVLNFFMKLPERIKTCKNIKTKLSQWMFAVIRNDLVSYLRKNKEILPLKYDPRSIVLKKNFEIYELSDILTKEEYEFVYLYYVLEFSRTEVCETMKITCNRFKYLSTRTKSIIKKYYEEVYL